MTTLFEMITTHDKAQSIRIKRHLLSASLWFIFLILSVVVMKADLLYMSSRQYWIGFFLALLGQFSFYIFLRSGLNKRLRDPSITIPQIIFAIIWATYLMLYTQEIRGMFMSIYLFTILFGIFQLNRGEFIFISILPVLGYGSVIIWDFFQQPPKFNLILNLTQLIILSVILAFLSMFGNYIKTIREKLKTSKLELENSYRELVFQKDKVEEHAFDLTTLNAKLHREVSERQEVEKKLNTSLSNLKETQSQLVQSEKMAALGSVVAGVAHEINTPLSVGITSASLLADKTEEYIRLYNNDKLKRSDLEKYFKIAAESSTMVLSNLNRAADLVSSFKQIAVDQNTEDRRLFNLKNYIEKLLFSLRPHLQRTSHNITLKCPEGIEIDSYPGVFFQIITNLIMNSLIHGFEEMEKGEIVINIWKEEKILVLFYSDNGKGMEQEILGKIFDPFFTTKRNRGGTGLGMNILYNLITRALGGKMECTSKPGEGVIFLILIPLKVP